MNVERQTRPLRPRFLSEMFISVEEVNNKQKRCGGLGGGGGVVVESAENVENWVFTRGHCALVEIFNGLQLQTTFIPTVADPQCRRAFRAKKRKRKRVLWFLIPVLNSGFFLLA